MFQTGLDSRLVVSISEARWHAVLSLTDVFVLFWTRNCSPPNMNDPLCRAASTNVGIPSCIYLQECVTVDSDVGDEPVEELSLRSKKRTSPSTSTSNLKDLDCQIARLIDCKLCCRNLNNIYGLQVEF
jgi:hypothetical protein